MINAEEQVINKGDKAISLVLSSGSARGLAHIGVIEALEEQGFTIQSIAGSSIGAVIGGVYAAGKLQEYKEFICGLKATDVLSLMDFTFNSQGIVKGEKIFNRMKQFLPEINIEELPIPFVAVGTDLRQKTEIVFREGSLYEAMRASVAIPGIFTPFMYQGREVVDGGVLHPIPIDFLVRIKGSQLVVSNINSNNGTTLKPSSRRNKKKGWFKRVLNIEESPADNSSERRKLLGIYNDSVSLMSDKITQLTVEKYEPDIMVNISKDVCGMFDFHLANELIELGRETCLNEINTLLSDH